MLFVLLERVLLVAFAVSVERQMYLCKHQEKGEKCVGSFLPWIIGVGEGHPGGNSPGDAAC